MFGKLREMLRFSKAKREWRKRNSHNRTAMVNEFPMDLVSVGKYTYGPLRVLSAGRSSKMKIGDYCSIGENVVFMLNIDHYLDHLSTFPFKVLICGEKSEAISKGDITLDDDVWIGEGATILSGVHIGRGGG